MGQRDPLYEQMHAANQANKVDLAEAQERLKESSRERLLKIVEKKIRTTMIGALAAVEETLGRELWGYGKPDKDCTPDELAWRAFWNERVRPLILNNGNSQLRAMQAELLLYNIMWTGYQNVMTVRKEQRKENDNGRTEDEAQGDVQGRRERAAS